MTEPIKPNKNDLRSAIMNSIGDVWDRAKQIDDAADEVLDLIEADRQQRGEPSVPESQNNENDLLMVLGVLSDCHLAIEDDLMSMGFDELLSRIIKSMNSIRAMLKAAPELKEKS